MKKSIALLLAMAMVLSLLPSVAVAEEADIASGLVLHYAFDSDSAQPEIIIDSSGNGNNGAVLNNIDQNVGSETEPAMYTKRITVEDGVAYFPGYERVSVNERDNKTVYGAAIKIPENVREGLSDYTVSMWVKPDTSYDFGRDYGFGDRLQRFFDFGIAERDSIFLRYRLSDGNFRFQDRGIGASADDEGSLEEMSIPEMAGSWSLVTVTYDAENAAAAVYVNGTRVLYGEDKFTRSIGDIGELRDGRYGMFLGRTQWFNFDSEKENNPDYKGYMDDVRIYNRALSEADVQELYASTNPEVEKTPVQAVAPSEVTTFVGSEPSLPLTVTVLYSDGSSREEKVVWEQIPAERYAAEGSFTVGGIAVGLPVRVTVNVVEDPEQNISSGLVLRYAFDSDPAQPEIIIDSSGNGNNGTVLNNIDQNVGNGRNPATYTKRITVENGVAYFPGYERVLVNNRNNKTVYGAAIKIPENVREGLSDYTVSMWVKPDTSYDFGRDYGFGDRLQRFFDFGITEKDSIFLRYRLSDGNFRFQDRGIGASADDASSLEETSMPKMAGEWSLVTVTYDAENAAAAVYVNGTRVLYGEDKFTRSIGDIGELTDGRYGMFLGRTQWFNNDTEKENNPDYKGYMDDVRIYNRALSEADVQELYKKTNPEGEKTPVQAVAPSEVTTLVGREPSLPLTVTVLYSNGSSSEEEVVWEQIPAERYAAEGSFAVGGIAMGLPVWVTVNVVANPEQSINAGMLAHYDFETDAAQPTVIKDVSGNGNDATVVNNVQSGGWTGNVNNRITVQDGKAVFPGCTKTTFPWGGFTMTNLGAALMLPNDFNQGIGDYTVSMWLYADGSYEFSGKTRIFDFGNRANNDTYNSIFARYDTTNEELMVCDRNLNKSFGATMENYPFKDKWGLLTVTYDTNGGRFVIYINGREFKSAAGYTRTLSDLGILNDSSNGMFIGRTQWYNSSIDENPDFKGKMDDIRIYGRTLTKEEVEKLYNDTNPERKLTVKVETVIYDEIIDDRHIVYTESEEVEAPENSYYSISPEATKEYNGRTYYFSKALSKTTIDGVSAENASLKVVYAIKKAENVSSISVEAYKGTAPVLPDKVEIAYQTGDTEQLSVNWDSVPADSYANVGSFEVRGTADGNEVKARVTVYEITAADVAAYVYTAIGSRPSLPANAKVTFSHRADVSYESIVWEEITEAQLAAGEDIAVGGRLANYPDVAVSTTICFVFEAEMTVAAIADTYTSTESSGNKNYGSGDELKITSTGGSGPAGYDRYGFFRFPGHAGDKVLGAKLRLFVRYIDNNRDTTYTVYAIAPEKGDWSENELTWNTQSRHIEGAQMIAQTTLKSTAYDEWLEFDISQYIAENPDLEYYNFYVKSDTCATYLDSREYGRNSPSIVYAVEGQRVSVNYVCDGAVVLGETVAAAKNASYTHPDPKKVIVADGTAYVYKSGESTIGNVDENNCTITYEMEETTDIVFEELTVNCYYDELPSVPNSIKATVKGYSVELPFELLDAKDFSEAGTYSLLGNAGGFDAYLTVNAYERYKSNSGTTLGYASLINITYVAGGLKLEKKLTEKVLVGTQYTVGSAMLSAYPQISDPKAENDGFTAQLPVHEVTVSGGKLDGVSARTLDAKLSGSDPAAYTLTVDVAAANMGAAESDVGVLIVRYDDNGKVVSFRTERLPLGAGTQLDSIEVTDTYNYEEKENIRIYLWEFGQLRPVDDVIVVSELELPRKYSDDVLALMPEYSTVMENVLRANDYRQSTWGPNTWVNGIHPAFWDTAAYHTGNMEAYFTFGKEEYKQYSTDWANGNNWVGNNNTGDKKNWTWGYDQTQGSNAVLFGDWQICFQSYLDLNLLDPEEKKAARAKEVMGYEITVDNDAFWWWADSLYMVTPVMTKMYLTTGNEAYLDALYKYYLYAAELMYDGDCGIPNEGEEYKTSAKLKSGAAYSDPANYANLFFRDANYVYPLNPNSGHENEKNFWARGNGWVFAGLAKVLEDMPSNYEHYGFFYTIYTEMAKAIIGCQQVDDQGRGFWTQSMLQDYPKGNNGNNEGYETSGTAFFTYGLFWGINSGILDEETYLESALRSWKYLSELALHSNGKVGYCQPIGSNATSATSRDTDQPFGYGAFLLAGCEVSRWVGGVTENNEPYLKRKLWGSVAFNGDKYYANGVVQGSASFENEGKLYVPAEELAALLGATALRSASGIEIRDELNDKGGIIMNSNIVEVNSVAYVPAELIAKLLGKHIISGDGFTVISHKANVFYDCDGNSVKYLKELLK